MIAAAVLPVDGLHALAWAAECLEHATPSVVASNAHHKPATRTGGRAVNSAIQLIIYERDLSIQPLQQVIPVQNPDHSGRESVNAPQGTGTKRKWSPAWATQTLTARVDKRGQRHLFPASTELDQSAAMQTRFYGSSRSRTPSPPVIMLDPATTPMTQSHHSLNINLSHSTALQVQPPTANVSASAMGPLHPSTVGNGFSPDDCKFHPPKQGGQPGIHLATAWPDANSRQIGPELQNACPQASGCPIQSGRGCAAPLRTALDYAPLKACASPLQQRQQQSADVLLTHTSPFALASFNNAAPAHSLQMRPVRKDSTTLQSNTHIPDVLASNTSRQQNTVVPQWPQDIEAHSQQQQQQQQQKQQQQQLQKQQEVQQNLQTQLQQQQAAQLKNLKQQLSDLQKLQAVLWTPSSNESGCVQESGACTGGTTSTTVVPVFSSSTSQTVFPPANYSSPCSAASLSDTSYSNTAGKGSERQIQDLASAAVHDMNTLDMDAFPNAGFDDINATAPPAVVSMAAHAAETVAAGTTRSSTRLRVRR